MTPLPSEPELPSGTTLDRMPVGTRIIAFREGVSAPAVFIRRISGLGNPYWADLIAPLNSYLLSADLVAMRFNRVHVFTPEETP